ncbi:MAG: hypothetical protein DDT34_02151 [Firmicutes bacterium]|nr:hypothetical protein [Bacillota bacterium]
MASKFNCLLVGEAGTGKTCFCGTLQACEKTSPCLFLDVDLGAMSLDSVSPRPTVLTVERWSQMSVVYDKLIKQDWQALANYIGTEMGKDVPALEYRSVVIDSGTELEYLLRSSIVAETGNEVPEQQHYLRVQERFKKLYRAFRSLPVSLVMTAGVRELKDDISGIVRHYPAFQPALTKDIVRMSDLVLFMNVVVEEKKWVRTLQTTLSQRVVARDRSQKLDPLIRGEKLYFKGIVEKILD